MTARIGPARGSEAGFSLVALVAAMTIMMILMGAAMPSWKYVMQNEREQELFFRGDQIASAIERYQKKNANAAPISLEVLVKGKYLRKAYKDPMTKDGKWRFVRAGEVQGARLGGPGGIAGAGRTGRPGGGRPSAGPSPGPGAGPGWRASPSGTVGDAIGPFVGVSSFSEDKSLRVMNGAESYDQWVFIAGRPRLLGRQMQVQAPGPNQPGAQPGPPQPGQPPPGSPKK